LCKPIIVKLAQDPVRFAVDKAYIIPLLKWYTLSTSFYNYLGKPPASWLPHGHE